MRVHYEQDRRRWIVRWRDDGRNRSRRFGTREEAEAFDRELVASGVRRYKPGVPPARQSNEGVYPYETAAGTRWRFIFRQSDGTQSCRRGFRSQRAAATARRRMLESIERGEVKVGRELIGSFWARLLEERRPYLAPGSS